MSSDWLKLTEWKYRHASADMDIEHDVDGWLLIWRGESLMWQTPFPTAEEAMQFANVWGSATNPPRQEVSV